MTVRGLVLDDKHVSERVFLLVGEFRSPVLIWVSEKEPRNGTTVSAIHVSEYIGRRTLGA